MYLSVLSDKRKNSSVVDRIDKHTRHRIMAANRGKDTGPELEVRKALYREGFRYEPCQCLVCIDLDSLWPVSFCLRDVQFKHAIFDVGLGFCSIQYCR